MHACCWAGEIALAGPSTWPDRVHVRTRIKGGTERPDMTKQCHLWTRQQNGFFFIWKTNEFETVTHSHRVIVPWTTTRNTAAAGWGPPALKDDYRRSRAGTGLVHYDACMSWQCAWLEIYEDLRLPHQCEDWGHTWLSLTAVFTSQFTSVCVRTE